MASKLWLLICWFLVPQPSVVHSLSSRSVLLPPRQTAESPKYTTDGRKFERILQFDKSEFPLAEIVAQAMECDSIEGLGKLHLREPEEFCEQGRIRASQAITRSPLRRVELLRRALTEKWKMSPQKREWENVYLPKIIRDVVGPEVMEKETQLIYQRAPMLRFHVAWPLQTAEDEISYDNTMPPMGGRNPGTLAGLHTDSEYGHPAGETNFFLPVTERTFGTNSLFVEGEAGLGDFAPFEMSYGEMMMWNGNSCRHCSPRNISNLTRISFDFRVIPGSQWKEPPAKKGFFQLGSYYMDAMAMEF